MKKKNVLIGLVAAVGLVGASNAADMAYQPYAPAPVPPPTWTGPYVGANLGYQWGSSALGTKPDGIVGGLQAGYNYQSGQFVIGAETDVQLSAADDTFASYKFSNPWFGTVRGRVGWAMNNILLYGTLGFAYGRGEVEWFGVRETKTLTGWAAGAGIEVALTPNWSARAEYLYVDLSQANYMTPVFNAGFESSILRFGLNYRF